MTNSDDLERSQFNNGLERSQLSDNNSSSQTQMILKIHGFAKMCGFTKIHSFYQNLQFSPKSTGIFTKNPQFSLNSMFLSKSAVYTKNLWVFFCQNLQF